jgi:hypothetical protein
MTPPAAAAAPRTRTRRPAPPARRVSGPARTPSSRARTAAAAAVASPAPLALRLGGAVHGLAEHRLLERIIRGRAWIGILAVGLIGIVFMQVSMLRMNAGIGQAVERSSVLERQNSATRAAISELSSGDRIGAEAQRLGLVVPAGTPRFLDARGADAHRALTSMTAPGEGIVPSAASEAVDPAAATPALGQSGVAPATAAATATTDGSAVGPGTGQAAGTQPATTTQAQPDAATQPAATPTGQDPAASYRTAAPPPPTGTTGGLDASGQAG